MTQPYDALLLVSFGGPEGPDDVLPFLENVLRGRNVPRERMLEVAEHYQHFGGVSPINEQNRALIKALRLDFDQHGLDLPIYWGNRNWHPMLEDTLKQMHSDGVRRVIAFVTSAFSSYSGCRQYREDIARASAAVGMPPTIDKLRVFFNHPGFIEAMSDHVREAFAQIPAEKRAACPLVFTAHSIPTSMSATCDYVMQLQESCRLVAEQVGVKEWQLAYQSRSGPPHQPWLEPDICDWVKTRHGESGLSDVVVVPIGFLSDHMEVKFDLDTELAGVCDQLGVQLVRAKTASVHPSFVGMIRELIQERMNPETLRSACGTLGPNHDVCPENCCPAPQRPTTRPS